MFSVLDADLEIVDDYLRRVIFCFLSLYSTNKTRPSEKIERKEGYCALFR